jgi:CRP-like cAMP-binding protein
MTTARSKTGRSAKIRDVAARLPFFSDLAGMERDVILPLCREIKGKAGELIIREGKPVKNLYVLVSGGASVFKERADGKQVLLASVGKGDVLGELSFLRSVLASATVKAKRPYRALAIDQKDLQRLLVTHLNIAAKLYRKLALIAGQRMSALLRHHFEGRAKL